MGLSRRLPAASGRWPFWCISGAIPKACIGAVGRSRPSVTKELARALELTTEVRHSAVVARDSAADSGRIMARLTRVQLWTPRTRLRWPPIILGQAPSDRSRGQEPVVAALASVWARRPALRRRRLRMKASAHVLSRSSSPGLHRRRSLAASPGRAPGKPVCTRKVRARNHHGTRLFPTAARQPPSASTRNIIKI